MVSSLSELLDGSGVLHETGPGALGELESSLSGDDTALETSFVSADDSGATDSSLRSGLGASSPLLSSKSASDADHGALPPLLDDPCFLRDLFGGSGFASGGCHVSVLVSFASHGALLEGLDKLACWSSFGSEQLAAQHAHEEHKISHFINFILIN